jgi:methyl-accepting chemotaxis protein
VNGRPVKTAAKETFRRGVPLAMRITLCVLLIVGGILAAQIYMISQRVRAAVFAESRASSLLQLGTLKDLLDSFLQDNGNLIRFNAERLAWEKPREGSAITLRGEVLSSRNGGMSAFVEAFAADGSGRIFAANTRALVGRSITDLEAWKAYKTGTPPYFISTRPSNSLSSRTPAVAIAAPISDSTQGFQGLFVGSLDINSIRSIFLNGRTAGKTGYFWLMDRNASPIAGPEGETPPAETLLSRFVDGRTGAPGEAIYGPAGNEHFAAWVALETLPWLACMTVPLEDLTALSRDVDWNMFLFGAASLIAIIVFLFILIRLFVTGRLRRLAKAVQKAAGGDLSSRVRMSGRDAIGLVAHHFNGLEENLRSLVGTLGSRMGDLKRMGVDLSSNMEETAAAINQINANLESTQGQIAQQTSAVDRTSETADRVSLTVEGLGAMIEGQAQAVTESSAAIEQMVSNIRSVSSNAETAHSLTSELLGVSAEGKKKLATVIGAIEQIARQSADLLQAARLISGIAANTNLLAMNASIEAAHAGEWGRGFAVVANEIRHLAEQASAQSKEIAKKLASIKNGIDGAAKTSHQTGEAFGIVFDKVEKAGAIVEQIQRSMAEQNEGSRQVLEGLRNINDVTFQVKDGSVQLKEGSGQILSAVARLTEANSAVRGNVKEIATGTSEINKAVSSVLNLAVSNKELIEELAAAAARFSTEKSGKK